MFGILAIAVLLGILCWLSGARITGLFLAAVVVLGYVFWSITWKILLGLALLAGFCVFWYWSPTQRAKRVKLQREWEAVCARREAERAQRAAARREEEARQRAEEEAARQEALARQAAREAAKRAKQREIREAADRLNDDLRDRHSFVSRLFRANHYQNTDKNWRADVCNPKSRIHQLLRNVGLLP